MDFNLPEVPPGFKQSLQDVQTDGGTHVASTAQVGHVEVVKVESQSRQNRRVRIRLTG